MNREQLLTELESLFDLPADSLRGDQQLQDIPAWDSVAVMKSMAGTFRPWTSNIFLLLMISST